MFEITSIFLWRLRGAKLKKKFFINLLITITLILSGCRSAPYGTSVKGNIYNVERVEFLTDQTYVRDDERIIDQEILKRSLDIIQEAENYVVIDMFLFNSLYPKEDTYPEITKKVMEALIAKKNEGVPIYFITDEVNSFYETYEVEEFLALSDAGIPVIETDMAEIKDSNITYSFLWRGIFRHFGTGEEGWMTNPFADHGPKVNLRSYLKLFNLKANHRKVIVADEKAVITSANFHDASAHHSNIGFMVEGAITAEILKSEIVTAGLSGFEIPLEVPEYTEEERGTGDIEVRLLTEGKIGHKIVKLIDESHRGEELKIGIFYLGDRPIAKAIKRAARRGVKVYIIMDSNVEAFGRSKDGIPNRQVAWELLEKGKGNIQVRWYNTTGEQYHAKFILKNNKDYMTIIGGSANFTKRNLYGYNFETNLQIKAPIDNEFSLEVNEYFDNMWNNTGGEFTLPYEERADESYLKYYFYRLQEFTGISSF